MPPETAKTATWKWVLGYVGFFVVALIFGLYVTFPYDTLKTRVQREADLAGFYVKMDSLGPGLLGVTADEVRISKKAADDAADAPPALFIDKISVRPALFPPGVAFRVKLMGGSITGNIGGLGDVSVRASVDEVTLSEGNLKAFSGVDLAGIVNGKLKLDIPAVAPPGGKEKVPDLSQANGSLTLEADSLGVNGGSMMIPMGGEPVPMDLPKIAIGTVEVEIPIEKGLATITKLHAKGTDLELFLAGTLKLARRIEYSEPAIDLKIKAEPQFVKNLGLIGAGLSMLGPDKTDPTFRAARITGYLNRPNFQPAR